MEKKATLLIKNLYQIYTMQEDTSKQIEKGFIALHHDKILDLGQHDFSCYVDKDTRIIDGTNHIAIPSFIEPCTSFFKTQTSMREYDEFFMRYMHNGTLNINLTNPVVDVLYKNYHYEILHAKPHNKMQVINVIEQMKQGHISIQGSFCISCANEQVALQNQMLAAQLLAMKEEVNAYALLQALTVYPATYLGCKDRGMLKAGMLANLLILSSRDIHAFFYSLDQNQIAQIIHRGVRIYPNLII